MNDRNMADPGVISPNGTVTISIERSIRPQLDVQWLQVNFFLRLEKQI